MKRKQPRGRPGNPGGGRREAPIASRRGRSKQVLITTIAGGLVLLAVLVLVSRRQLNPSRSDLVTHKGTGNAPASPAGIAVRHSSSPSANQEQVIRKLNQANQFLAQGQPAEAVQVLNEALQLNPQDEDVHYNLGLALTRLGKIDEAIQQYTEALRIFPDYAEAHNNLGNVLMRAGRPDEAIAHFEASIRIMPDYASAHNNFGTALQRVGRTNDALTQFQKAVQLSPDYWEAHFNVGTSLLQAGRLGEARTEFETVLRLKPDFPPAKAALAEVQTRQSRTP